MNVEVHLLSHDAEQMIVWALRHYRTFATRIIVHDGGPKGVSSELAKVHGAEAQPWDTAGELNDELARVLKNSCWRGTKADWVIVADADELLYFPLGVEVTLGTYERIGAAVPRPEGFEMFSASWPEPADHPEAQIYDFVRDGAPEREWYSKPVLFSARRVLESGFGIGAHESEPLLKTGRRLRVNRDWPLANPPSWLLHFHHIGSLERVAARYDATRKRLAMVNVNNNWGNVHDTGLQHALKKRERILPHLQRVIA